MAEADADTLKPATRKAVEAQLRSVVDTTTDLLNRVDPIRQPLSLFDPGDPKIVGRFIGLAMVAQRRHALAEVLRSYGSGVYAIYYTGDYPLYAPISGSETPLYVGQAAPANNKARTPREQGPRLSARLAEHAKSIGSAVSTLSINDFECRLLVVQSGWETAAEDYLIHLFRPIWNSEINILYGLGKHGDAATTRGNKRSPWDTMHPGRKWAEATAEDARTPMQIEAAAKSHFETHPAFRTLDAVVAGFIDQLRQVT